MCVLTSQVRRKELHRIFKRLLKTIERDDRPDKVRMSTEDYMLTRRDILKLMSVYEIYILSTYT